MSATGVTAVTVAMWLARVFAQAELDTMATLSHVVGSLGVPRITSTLQSATAPNACLVVGAAITTIERNRSG